MSIVDHWVAVKNCYRLLKDVYPDLTIKRVRSCLFYGNRLPSVLMGDLCDLSGRNWRTEDARVTFENDLKGRLRSFVLTSGLLSVGSSVGKDASVGKDVSRPIRRPRRTRVLKASVVRDEPSELQCLGAALKHVYACGGISEARKALDTYASLVG